MSSLPSLRASSPRFWAALLVLLVVGACGDDGGSAGASDAAPVGDSGLSDAATPRDDGGLIDDGGLLPDAATPACDGVVCGAHATCELSGGEPTCFCDDGYEGDGQECIDVDECATAAAGCGDHATCTNTDGAFMCLCDDGYMGDGFSCADVDECAPGMDACPEHSTCANSDGSFTCTCEPGYDGTDCDTCVDGYVDVGGICEIKSCSNTSLSCGAGACFDGLDGPMCGPPAADPLVWLSAEHLSLTDGAKVATWADLSGNGNDASNATAATQPIFKSDAANGLPVVGFAEDSSRSHPRSLDVDIDTSNPGAGPSVFAVVVVPTVVTSSTRVGTVWGNYPSGPSYNCELYTLGSPRFYWNNADEDRKGSTDTRTQTATILSYYRDADNDLLQVFVNGTLDAEGSAGSNVSFEGPFRVGGDFRSGNDNGLIGDIGELIVYDRVLTDAERASVETYLADKWGIDPCASSSFNDCDPHATCTSETSGYSCACNAGYDGDGYTCADVDECSADPTRCGDHGTCVNSDGDYQCSCDLGYGGDHACDDIDECAAGTDTCDDNASCANSEGSFSCACDGGYAGDGYVCDDIDECVQDPDRCGENSLCANTPGSYVCSCAPGFEEDASACVDIDECAGGAVTCAADASCNNTLGAYFCANDTLGLVTGLVYWDGGGIGLRWEPPADPDWAGVQVVRSVVGVAANPYDGEVVFTGKSQRLFDETAVAGVAYTYSVWSMDADGSFSAAPATIAVTGAWASMTYTASTTITPYDPDLPYMKVLAWGAGGGGGLSGSGGQGGGGGFATSATQTQDGQSYHIVVGGAGLAGAPGGYNGIDDVGRGGYGNCSDSYGGAVASTRGGSGGQMSGVYLVPAGGGIPTDVDAWIAIAGGGGGGSVWSSRHGGGGGGSSGQRGSGNGGHGGAGGIGGNRTHTYGPTTDGQDWVDGGDGGQNASAPAAVGGYPSCGGGGGGGYGGGGGAADGVDATGGGGGGGGYARDDDGVGRYTTMATGRTPAETSSPLYPDATSPGYGGTRNGDGNPGAVVIVYNRCPPGMGGAACDVDIQAPRPIALGQVTAGQVTLSWTEPADVDYQGVRIVRSTLGFPATPYDGEIAADVSKGTTSYSETSVDGHYYYTLFAHDAAGNFASGVDAESEQCLTECRLMGSAVLQVPAGTSEVTAYAWGAGGAGTAKSNRSNRGGGGGFAQSDTTVTPGSFLRVIVGGGGGVSGDNWNGVDDIGRGGGCSGGCGRGGQMSGVVLGTTLTTDISAWLVIAGGGGGGGAGYQDNGDGGGGGGPIAQSGESLGGQGGQDGLGGLGRANQGYGGGGLGDDFTAGGSGGNAGGSGSTAGGAGGGGYGGGGGGAVNTVASGGGGGGAGYALGADGNTRYTTAATGQTAAESTHTLYPTTGSPGQGGDAGENGRDGYVVVQFE